MTAVELYVALYKAGIDFEVQEIFDGYRWLKFEVEEEIKEEESTPNSGDDVFTIDMFGRD